MKYCLIVQLKNDSYEIKGYNKIPGFEHIKEEKLKSIIEFTNNFKNEQELICYLINEKIIPEKYFKGNIKINYYKNENTTPKTLKYGVSFAEDKKFFDTIFLKHYFCNQLTNIKFMELFITKYYNYLKNITVFQNPLKHINYCYNYYLKQRILPLGADESIMKFIDIYCSKKSKNGFYKADFTRIRDLAMFAINYERNYVRTPQERPKYSKKELNELILHYKEVILTNSLSEEELNAYKETIYNLEQELNYIKTLSRSRR